MAFNGSPRGLDCAEAVSVHRAVYDGLSTMYNDPQVHIPKFCPAAVCRAAGLPWEEGSVPDWAAQAHARFAQALHAAHVGSGPKACVAVWLDATVERDIASAWTASPEHAFWLHSVALQLCMGSIGYFVKEIVRAQCAPVPQADPEIADGLCGKGLPCAIHHGEWRVMRQYAVVTHAVYKGCGACALHTACGAQLQRKTDVRKNTSGFE